MERLRGGDGTAKPDVKRHVFQKPDVGAVAQQNVNPYNLGGFDPKSPTANAFLPQQHLQNQHENQHKGQPQLGATTQFAPSQAFDLTPELLPDNPARSELKAYLAQNCAELDKGEIDKILSVAKALETHAVNAFQAQSSHQKNLLDQNRLAINKLATNSASAKTPIASGQKTFSCAQIGAMSLQEFRDNRAEIFANYVKGQIL